MSGLRYLADTNAFIFLLDKHPALKNLLESDWYFSFITEIEHALIAATAIFHDLPLLTFDKGFSQIKSVDLILLEQ